MNNRIIGLLLFTSLIGTIKVEGQNHSTERLEIPSGDWVLIADLVVPAATEKPPIILLLNQAAGNRKAYEGLALALAKEGLASLRVDLPGHGESTNAGKFTPGKNRRDPMIWDAEKNVADVISFARKIENVSGFSMGAVGASYSGEELAEAGRLSDFIEAYVILSSGSFSDASIEHIDKSGSPWLIVAAREDRYLTDIVAKIQSESKFAELLLLPGKLHATDLLQENDQLQAMIASWLKHRLN